MSKTEPYDNELAELDNEIEDAISFACSLDEQAASAWSAVQRLETKRIELVYKLRAALG